MEMENRNQSIMSFSSTKLGRSLSGKGQLDCSTSVFLNAVRFLAALTVFLGHLSGRRFTGGLLWPLAAFMDTAVIIFFVLSGFVIAYVTEDHERDLQTYAINRIARIYSVALPALILALILDSVGRYLRPELYSATWGFSSQGIWLQYLTSAVFVQRIWWNEITPGSILPYWSLGYEVWYYVIFAILYYATGTWRVVLGLVACFCAGPNILSLFPIWLLGFATYRVSKGAALPKGAAGSIIVATALLLGVLMYLASQGFSLPRLLVTRYLVAIVFALNILAVRQFSFSPSVLRMIERPVGWLAGMTFSLYLFHLPVAQFLSVILPWPPQAMPARVAIFGGTFLLIVALAELTERKKGAWRNGVAVLYGAISSVIFPRGGAKELLAASGAPDQKSVPALEAQLDAGESFCEPPAVIG